MTETWVAPTATQFSCLCEPCVERERLSGSSFAEAMRLGAVRGAIPAESDVAFARCAGGHEIVIRRVETPPGLAARNDRQLQIA